MFRINYSKLLKTTSAFWFDSCSRIIKTRSTTVSPMLPGNSDTAVLMMIPVRSGPSKISHRYTMNTSKDVDLLPHQLNHTLDEVQKYVQHIARFRLPRVLLLCKKNAWFAPGFSSHTRVCKDTKSFIVTMIL